MTKNETKLLLNKIKGYYNSQFFIDEFVIEAWFETMEPYDVEDTIEHLIKWLEKSPDYAPKPHTFKQGLLTKKQKEKRKHESYIVSCNLCGKEMTLSDYDDHYGKCFDIEYLLSVAKEYGEDITREKLENARDIIIEKLLDKYPPEEIEGGFIEKVARRR